MDSDITLQVFVGFVLSVTGVAVLVGIRQGGIPPTFGSLIGGILLIGIGIILIVHGSRIQSRRNEIYRTLIKKLFLEFAPFVRRSSFYNR